MRSFLVAVLLVGALGSWIYTAARAAPDKTKYQTAEKYPSGEQANSKSRRSGDMVPTNRRDALYMDPSQPVPLGLPKLEIPADNPMTPEKIQLGMQLFFDKRLSVDNSVSCASCHDPDKGWSNGEAVATGIRGQKGRRNVPTLLNVAINPVQFWDGRAASLEQQALVPLLDAKEMGMPSAEALEKKLNGINGYKRQFEKIFGGPVKAGDVAKALATFERTLLTGDAPQDRYIHGEKSALSAAAQRGFKLFTQRARCSRCHANANLSVSGFANIGLPVDPSNPDLGREEISKSDEDHLGFKVPTLREIGRTGPYMHNGTLKTLEEIVDHYGKRGTNDQYIDRRLHGFHLSPGEKDDLVTFLREGMNGGTYPYVKPPTLPE